MKNLQEFKVLQSKINKETKSRVAIELYSIIRLKKSCLIECINELQEGNPVMRELEDLKKSYERDCAYLEKCM